MDEQSTDVVPGTLDMLILRTLSLAPMHAFGIARRVEQISRGVFKVNAGSLLVALQRLERSGWLDAEWRETENKRQGRFYSLTRAGRKQLQVETGRVGPPGRRNQPLAADSGERVVAEAGAAVHLRGAGGR